MSRTWTLNIGSAMLRSGSVTRSRSRSTIARSVRVATVGASNVQDLIAWWGCAEDSRIRGDVRYRHGFDLAVQRVSGKNRDFSKRFWTGLSCNVVWIYYRVTAEKWYNFSNDVHALHIETGNDNCYDSMDCPFIYNNRKLGKKPWKRFSFKNTHFCEPPCKELGKKYEGSPLTHAKL